MANTVLEFSIRPYFGGAATDDVGPYRAGSVVDQINDDATQQTAAESSDTKLDTELVERLS